MSLHGGLSLISHLGKQKPEEADARLRRVSASPRRRSPAGLRNPVCNLEMLLFCALCAGHSACTRLGWYHYPRSVSHVSETLRGRGLKRQTLPLLGLGRGCPQRTQRAFGTAMRLCASLSRGVAAPLGCVIFSVSVEIAACMPCAQGLFVCARRGVVSLPSARFTCC